MKYYCHACKKEHEGESEYQIVESYIFKALKDNNGMTPNQYANLYRKASFGVCRYAINILLFPSDEVKRELEMSA